MRLAIGIISFPAVTGLFISNSGFEASLFRLQASLSARRHSYFGSPCGYRYNVARCQSNTQDMEKSDGKMNDEDDFDDSDARSQFGYEQGVSLFSTPFILMDTDLYLSLTTHGFLSFLTVQRNIGKICITDLVILMLKSIHGM